MSKATVMRIFWSSLIALAGGLIVLLIAGGVGVAGTGLTMRGPDVVGIQPTSATWIAASVGMLGVIAVIGGAVGMFVAWIGALLNTAQLTDKTWFVVLLLLGIFNLGFIPLLVYVLAGPDGTASLPAQASLEAPATVTTTG